MKGTVGDPRGKHEKEVRTIPTWVRRYAQNRTLPMLVFFGIYAVGAGVIAGLWCLTEWAWVTGHRLLTGASLLLLTNAVVCLMWFTFVSGARISHSIAQRLYRREGNVSATPSPEGKAKRGSGGGGFLGIFCMIGVVACTEVCLFGLIPIRYMQPISALYLVPFIVYVWIRGRGAASPILLLWPVLYGIHAILLVVHVPIYFGGEWDGHPTLLQGLNIAIPLLGYALIAALAGHIYSRIALRRLRALAASPESQRQEEGEE